MTGVGAYLRVSTDKQTTANQQPEVFRLIEGRETDFSGNPMMYVETVSATAKERPEFARMMEDARLGRIRRLYFWSLDRFGRSMHNNIRDLTTLLDTYNVKVFSVRESWIEMGNDPHMRRLLLAIFSWVAEHEHERLKERTRAGLTRARAAGKSLGRPKVRIPDLAIDLAVALRRRRHGGEGVSWRSIAKEVKHQALGDFTPSTLAAECLKRVPDLDRGKVGWQRSSRR